MIGNSLSILRLHLDRLVRLELGLIVYMWIWILSLRDFMPRFEVMDGSCRRILINTCVIGLIRLHSIFMRISTLILRALLRLI